MIYLESCVNKYISLLIFQSIVAAIVLYIIQKYQVHVKTMFRPKVHIFRLIYK